jgi:hypothetical protein
MRILTAAAAAVTVVLVALPTAHADDEFTLGDDLDTVYERLALQGRWASINLGIMGGYIPIGPPVGTSDSLPAGATAQWPLYLWLQTTTPLLLTRHESSFGIETDSTIGVSFTPDSEEERFLNWSTQGMFSLTTRTIDTFFTTVFAGAGLQRGQSHWWRERVCVLTNASVGVRFNLPGDGDAYELGYAYEPTLSTLRDATVGNGASLGPTTHAAHRVWIEPLQVLVRITYVHDVVRYDGFIDKPWRGHRILLTLYIP